MIETIQDRDVFHYLAEYHDYYVQEVVPQRHKELYPRISSCSRPASRQLEAAEASESSEFGGIEISRARRSEQNKS